MAGSCVDFVANHLLLQDVTTNALPDTTIDASNDCLTRHYNKHDHVVVFLFFSPPPPREAPKREKLFVESIPNKDRP